MLLANTKNVPVLLMIGFVDQGHISEILPWQVCDKITKTWFNKWKQNINILNTYKNSSFIYKKDENNTERFLPPLQLPTRVQRMMGKGRALTCASSTTTKPFPVPVHTSWNSKQTSTPAMVGSSFLSPKIQSNALIISKFWMEYCFTNYWILHNILHFPWPWHCKLHILLFEQQEQYKSY